MFRSLRTRLILACVLLVLLTAGALMWFAHKDTIIALRNGERRSLNNILFVLERELAASHEEGLYAKVHAVEAMKAALTRAAHRAAETLAALAAKPEAERSLALWALSQGDETLDLRFFRLDEEGNAHDLADGERPAAPLYERMRALPQSGEGEFFFTPGADAKLFKLLRAGDIVIVCSRPLRAVEEAAARRMDEAASRFKSLLREVRVQQTGFAAVLDAQGDLLVGPAGANVPEKLRQTLATGVFTGASRRLMILPAEGTDEKGEILYLLGYFPPLRWHIVLAAPLNELEAPATALVGNQFGITLAVAAGGMLLGLFLAGRIAHPVRRLSALARSLPERDIMTLDAEEMAKELPLRRADEVGELSRSFAYMASELRRNVEELLAATAVRQRLASELQVARDIQYGILPAAFAERTDVDLFAAMWTANEVGGDLYDYFLLDERRLCFAIGDVSDKSIPAALFMSMTVTLVRMVMHETGMSPEKALARINDILARDNPRNMFVSLCIGILDLATGELVWASGGHMPPVRVSREGARSLAASQDMVVGAFEGMSYRLLHDRLRPGDSLFLYTDGVSEAMNADKELFGETRLLAALSPLGGKSSKDISETVRAAVQAHAAGAEQSDDIAIMALRCGADMA